MARRLEVSLSIINVPSDDPSLSRSFFEKLLGIEMAPALSDEEAYHAPVSADGIDLNVTKRHVPQEGMIPFFGTRDLPGTLASVADWGGEVIWGPEALAIRDPSDFES